MAELLSFILRDMDDYNAAIQNMEGDVPETPPSWPSLLEYVEKDGVIVFARYLEVADFEKPDQTHYLDQDPMYPEFWEVAMDMLNVFE